MRNSIYFSAILGLAFLAIRFIGLFIEFRNTELFLFIGLGILLLVTLPLYLIERLRYKKKKASILKKYKIPLVIQHTQGIPENMQNHPRYENELLDIYDFFEKKINLKTDFF